MPILFHRLLWKAGTFCVGSRGLSMTRAVPFLSVIREGTGALAGRTGGVGSSDPPTGSEYVHTYSGRETQCESTEPLMTRKEEEAHGEED